MSPQRTCVGCRRVDDQSALRRLVQQGTMIVDGTNPRTGRGAYVHADCLSRAVRNKAFARAFPGAVIDPAILEP